MSEAFAIKYSWLIPLLPLIGAVLCGLLGPRLLKQRSHWPIWLSVGASAALSVWLTIVVLAQHAAPGEPVCVSMRWFT